MALQGECQSSHPAEVWQWHFSLFFSAKFSVNFWWNFPCYVFQGLGVRGKISFPDLTASSACISIGRTKEDLLSSYMSDVCFFLFGGGCYFLSSSSYCCNVFLAFLGLLSVYDIFLFHRNAGSRPTKQPASCSNWFVGVQVLVEKWAPKKAHRKKNGPKHKISWAFRKEP